MPQILTFGAFAIAFTPAQILAKATYAGLGFFYWFLIPVLCAMTRRQRAMIPSPLYDIPTDAEYAMEVIAHRIAVGGSVERPDKKHVKNLQQAYGAKTKGELPEAVLSKTSLGAPLSASNSRGTPLASQPAIVVPEQGTVRDFATEQGSSTIATTEVSLPCSYLLSVVFMIVTSSGSWQIPWSGESTRCSATTTE